MHPKRKLTWLWASLGVLVILVAGGLAYAIPAGLIPDPFISAKTASLAISPAEGYAKLEHGSFILDVRTQPEWNQFHIKGSTLIPVEQLATRLNELPKNQDIMVVCLTGVRSQRGAAILQQAGFPHVSYVRGGLQAWMAAGYPVERATP
jgi:rhodanese-related sulfurtransferase